MGGQYLLRCLHPPPFSPPPCPSPRTGPSFQWINGLITLKSTFNIVYAVSPNAPQQMQRRIPARRSREGRGTTWTTLSQPSAYIRNMHITTLLFFTKEQQHVQYTKPPDVEQPRLSILQANDRMAISILELWSQRHSSQMEDHQTHLASVSTIFLKHETQSTGNAAQRQRLAQSKGMVATGADLSVSTHGGGTPAFEPMLVVPVLAS